MTERERLIAIIEKAQAEAADTIGSMNGGMAAWYADKLLEAGVAPVVRCKDCEHYTNFDTHTCKRLTFHWCKKFGNITRESDFCSYGERKQA